MPIFTLYLSTLITSSTTSNTNNVIPINKTNLANVTWNIDWKNIFKGNEDKYKFCRVRYYLMSQSFAAAGGNYNSFTGFLACNLASTYHSSPVGTILNLLSCQDCPTTGTSTHCIINNYLSDCGVDINIPSIYNQTLTLSFYNDDAFNFISNMPEYQILLTFELYND